MRYMQLRKGPKKVFFLGLLTPICDSIKLFFKGFVVVLFSNEIVFLFAPLLSVFFLMVMWILYPFAFFSKDFYFGVVVFLCVRRLKVYRVLGSGWGSNSKYSLLGSIRGAAQVISYELVLVFVMLVPLVFQSSFSLGSFLWEGFWYGVLVLPLWVLWVVCCVAETNRSPFDFSEGERELVSGFKTEYRSLGFAFLFLGEYGQIIFIRMISILIFFSFGLVLLNVCIGVFCALCFIWFRSTFPRFRYDLLMEWCWVYCLVFVFFFFFCFFFCFWFVFFLFFFFFFFLVFFFFFFFLLFGFCVFL